ncbi:D-alanine--D-alanine ligase [Gammaproteobacteria bacterium]|nr:D-alanine--D-alanine ligase [Gammaproteobacteria bacterium]
MHCCVIFGGKSAEHDISLISAGGVIPTMNELHDLMLIYIQKDGMWSSVSVDDFIASQDPEQWQLKSVNINLTEGGFEIDRKLYQPDVVFPVLHGQYGESGHVQGLLEMMNLPFVGSGLESSVLCLNKILAKQTVSRASIAVAPWITFNQQAPSFKEVVEQIGKPFFIKAACSGSSIGVALVEDQSQYLPAIEAVFQLGDQVLLESLVVGRELECAVLEHGSIQCAPPAEIQVAGWYDYAAKYDNQSAKVIMPAELEAKEAEQFMAMAKQAFIALGCSGYARVDGFLTKSGQVIFNEINTIPGFTPISVFPKAWANQMSFSTLIDRMLLSATRQS